MGYTGSCLCGEIRFRVESELEPIQLCYCQQCRKAHGGAFAAVIPVAVSAFRLLSGEQSLKAYESSPGKERVFCGRCGSPVFSRRPSVPSVVRLRAGLLDEPVPVKPAWHAHTGSKCSWWSIGDGLPQYRDGHAPSASTSTGPDEAVLTKDSVMQFLNRFEELAEKEDFDLIQGMVHEAAFFRFNDGDFTGKPAVRAAFEKTWKGSAGVKKERFYLTDVQVLSADAASATATYTYNWEGSMDGKSFRVQGRGTRVLVVEDGRLQIIHEHLSRFPKQ